MTVTTLLVALWARLRQSAMVWIDSSTVQAPTVDPGLGCLNTSFQMSKKADLLEVVELQAELLASLQVIYKAFI